jgi:hypothetical protein
VWRRSEVRLRCSFVRRKPRCRCFRHLVRGDSCDDCLSVPTNFCSTLWYGRPPSDERRSWRAPFSIFEYVPNMACYFLIVTPQVPLFEPQPFGLRTIRHPTTRAVRFPSFFCLKYMEFYFDPIVWLSTFCSYLKFDRVFIVSPTPSRFGAPTIPFVTYQLIVLQHCIPIYYNKLINCLYVPTVPP